MVYPVFAVDAAMIGALEVYGSVELHRKPRPGGRKFALCAVVFVLFCLLAAAWVYFGLLGSSSSDPAPVGNATERDVNSSAVRTAPETTAEAETTAEQGTTAEAETTAETETTTGTETTPAATPAPTSMSTHRTMSLSTTTTTTPATTAVPTTTTPIPGTTVNPTTSTTVNPTTSTTVNPTTSTAVNPTTTIAPVIATTAPEPELPEVEAGALAHWVLGGAGEYNDLVSSSEAIAVGEAPTEFGNYIRLSPGSNGLQTQIMGTQFATMCFIVRALGASAQVLGGNLYSPGAGNKIGMYASSTLIASIPSVLAPAIILPLDHRGGFHFSCMVIDGNAVTVFSGVQLGSVSEIGSFGALYNPSEDAVGIGNLYYTDLDTDGMDYAEAIFFSGPRSVSQLQAVYERSVTRMALRGLTIE